MSKCQICNKYDKDGEYVKAVGGRIYVLCMTHRLTLDNFMWDNHSANFDCYDKAKMKLKILIDKQNLDLIDACWDTLKGQEKVFRQIVGDWVNLQIQ